MVSPLSTAARRSARQSALEERTSQRLSRLRLVNKNEKLEKEKADLVKGIVKRNGKIIDLLQKQNSEFELFLPEIAQTVTVFLNTRVMKKPGQKLKKSMVQRAFKEWWQNQNDGKKKIPTMNTIGKIIVLNMRMTVMTNNIKHLRIIRVSYLKIRAKLLLLFKKTNYKNV
jgi:hypothetical protein